MIECNQAKILIDEAERPDRFPFEVDQHLEGCASCRAFADQRASLRLLLASSARVSAPTNFEAALQARLEAAKSRRWSSWFTPAAYWQMGAATAALVLAVVAAQSGGWFNTSQPPTAPAENSLAPTAKSPTNGGSFSADTGSVAAVPPLIVESVESVVTPRRMARLRTAGSAIAARGRSYVADSQMMIVREAEGERVVPMPVISVGAQPLIFVSGQPARSGIVKASF